MSRPRRPPILLTGAIGYVGGRLLRVLDERGEWAVDRLLGGRHNRPAPVGSEC